MVGWCWVNFQCPGVLLILIVGQGPTGLTEGASWSCLDIFYSPLSFLFSFSLSLGDGTKILSQKAIKPKTTNQHYEPTHLDLCCLLIQLFSLMVLQVGIIPIYYTSIIYCNISLLEQVQKRSASQNNKKT